MVLNIVILNLLLKTAPALIFYLRNTCACSYCISGIHGCEIYTVCDKNFLPYIRNHLIDIRTQNNTN